MKGSTGTLSQESSEWWTNPSAPPISTKTPNARIAVTVPFKMSPSDNSFSNCSRNAALCSCPAARSDKITLFLLLLISITLIVIVFPIWALNDSEPSPDNLVPTICETGINPFTPSILASNPPLLNDVIVASMLASSSKYCCRMFQPSSPFARSIDNATWPSAVSGCVTTTFILSPTLILSVGIGPTECISSAWTIPSDLPAKSIINPSFTKDRIVPSVRSPRLKFWGEKPPDSSRSWVIVNSSSLLLSVIVVEASSKDCSLINYIFQDKLNSAVAYFPHPVTQEVSSALWRFTIVFGMRTSGAVML